MAAFTIKGLTEVLENVVKLRDDTLRAQRRAVDEETHALWLDVRDRTAHQFQEVPSYIVESLMGLPGTKAAFANPDLVGFFARRGPAPSIPWDRQVQQYRKGFHFMHNLLREEVNEPVAGFIVGRVGYPAEVGRRGSRTRAAVWVLFGTSKMHARPFLTLTLDERGPGFRAAVEQAFREVLGLIEGV